MPASDPIVAVSCMLLSSEDLTGKQRSQARQGSPGIAGGDGGDEDGGLEDDAEEVVLVDDPAAAAAPESAQTFAAGQKVMTVQLHPSFTSPKAVATRQGRSLVSCSFAALQLLLLSSVPSAPIMHQRSSAPKRLCNSLAVSRSFAMP